MNLQEKIKFSERLVDKYLDEVAGADLANIVIGGANAAANLSNEVRGAIDWAKKKLADRKKQRLLDKKKKKQEKLRLAMLKQHEKNAKDIGTL